jgi:hypothetical protein
MIRAKITTRSGEYGLDAKDSERRGDRQAMEAGPVRGCEDCLP